MPGTGVLAEHALEYAVESLEQYGQKGGGGGLPGWLTMDLGLVPATLTLRLERVQSPDSSSKYFEYYPPSHVFVGSNKVFSSGSGPGT